GRGPEPVSKLLKELESGGCVARARLPADHPVELEVAAKGILLGAGREEQREKGHSRAELPWQSHGRHQSIRLFLACYIGLKWRFQLKAPRGLARVSP